MADQARYNSTEGLVQVRFASGGPGGVPNVYQYPGISETEWMSFISGRLGGGRTYPVLMSWPGSPV
jgi:hypothetical protein